MGSINNSGLGTGVGINAQSTLEEGNYSKKLDENIGAGSSPQYVPTKKHDSSSNWGSPNPIKSQAEGQSLLDTGYKDGKQIYNVTKEGKIVKFQPDNSPQNGYHAYEVSSPRDIPSKVLKQMYKDGKITKSEYTKLRKGKKR